MLRRKLSEPFLLLPPLFKWLLLAVGVGILSGSASAAFLFALDWVTRSREAVPQLIFFLPVAGLAIGWIDLQFGQSVQQGSNLLIDEIHNPQKIVPLRMAPLVLLGTLVTHLFGGSAGREGTAVQMGGSLADQFTWLFRLAPQDRRILLMTGISAGFASVFGTPLAGAIFGIEVLSIGRLRYEALFPCLLAAIVGNQVTLAWGIHHETYFIPMVPLLSFSRLLAVMGAGILFGWVGMAFAHAVHDYATLFRKWIAYPPLRPFVGGILVVVALWLVGTTRYIGLGLPGIAESFSGTVSPWDFAGKFFFTVLTLGSFFKGGEVTPLFFIGATFGNTLSRFLPLPAPLLAGVGFVAVFAGAANTPLASTLLALELFGPRVGVYAAVGCVMSYLFSGHAGIYRAQQVEQEKYFSAKKL